MLGIIEFCLQKNQTETFKFYWSLKLATVEASTNINKIMSSELQESKIEIPLHERKPIGDRILGDIDPRTMTQQEFASSPDILFHGSAKPFKFRPVYSYQDTEYHKENDGSSTLGFGFYTSNSETEAHNYSNVRQGGKPELAYVTPILPFQARVLDLRWKDDSIRNAPFPSDLAEAWKKAFFAYYNNRKPRTGNAGIIHDLMENEYTNHLGKALKLKAVDLRVLLQTAGSPELKNSKYPGPPWTILFPEFMKSQGYDGLIYNEGGEGWDSHGPSFVFYNLEKVGTLESWQNKTE